MAYLHGFLGDAASWDGVVPRDSEHRSIALPGHGGGPVQNSWAANLRAIAGAIGASEVVVGYSLGARVAAGLVVSGHVPRAILISVNPGIDDADRAARRASDAVWAQLIRNRGVREFLTAWEAQPLFASQTRVSEARLAARHARRLQHDPEQLARSLEVMGLAEMPDYRNTITSDRFALIAGADDPKYVAIARTLRAPLEIIAGSGHDPTLEQPDALAAAIDRLLGS
ncbi:MAG: alpha/beta fold hydrolase [Kofleriaceae bacterium]